MKAMANLKMLLMILVAFTVSTVLLVSCSDDDKDSSSTTPSGSISAFFPEGYSANNVVAWYLYNEVQQDGTQRAEAVFLFNNNTIVVTSHRIKSNGSEKREIEYVGTYQLTSGDYDNGTVYVPAMSMTVPVQNGKITPMGSEVYTRQSNANIPAPQSPTTDNGDNGGNGGSGDNGGNGGGDNNGDYQTTPEAYLPSTYAEKTIAAWYSSTFEDNNKTKIQAVFLFTDGSLVVTTSKVYTIADGRSPEYGTVFAGTYELTSGDYSNGTAYVPEMNMSVSISQNVLVAMGDSFTKQDNANAPAPK